MTPRNIEEKIGKEVDLLMEEDTLACEAEEAADQLELADIYSEGE